MRTDQLIDLLARHAGPAPRFAPMERVVPAMLIGLVFTTTLALLAMGMAHEARTVSSPFLLKVIYGSAVALAAVWCLDRLVHPGAAIAGPVVALGSVAFVMIAASVVWLARQPFTDTVVLGRSWATCPIAILVLAGPGVATLLMIVRAFAPVRPVGTGFAAGLLGGALAAVGYAFACYETSPAFVAVWYSLGILLSGLAGALAGSRLLRW